MSKPEQSRQDDPFNDDDWGQPGGEQPSADEMPQPSREERFPFLKPHHVGSARTGTLELISVTNESTEYSDVIFVLQFKGKNFRLGMKIFSNDYKALAKRFGTKRADWHGQLRYKVMAHKGNPDGYIAVR